MQLLPDPRRINGQWLLPIVVKICILAILDFIRPDFLLVQPFEAPRPNPQQNKAARGTEGPTGPTHTGLAGLEGTS
ncbi:hypothetical protein LA080_008531 [Diaporthe eres]|uniref:Uncharacterized protein n=1 Tax=Diaporthe vaccinii TaxID=105482 RepID=A0ABR4F621_9PEZI|nr:hypothetical protein LA080_008531 [Diaporthe eres]